jgi:hypothetical protein
MKMQMKTLMAGPNGVIKAGQVVELPEAEAQALIDGGYAISAEIIALPLGGLTPVKASEPEPAAEETEPAVEDLEPETEKPATRRRRK